MNTVTTILRTIDAVDEYEWMTTDLFEIGGVLAEKLDAEPWRFAIDLALDVIAAQLVAMQSRPRLDTNGGFDHG